MSAVILIALIVILSLGVVTTYNRLVTLRFRNAHGEMRLRPRTDCTVRAVDRALDRVERASGAVKRRFLDAAAHCVAADGTVSMAEGELLRCFSDAIDAPMPPIGDLAQAVPPVAGRGESDPPPHLSPQADARPSGHRP